MIVRRALRGLFVGATLSFALALGTSHAAALDRAGKLDPLLRAQGGASPGKST